MWQFVRRWILLALAPALVAATMGFLQMLRGPFWSLGNADPSYPYLFGMLNLLNGRTVAIYEHPGIPVQTLGAAVLWAVGGFSDPALITARVLAEPELYLWLVSVCFLGVLALSLVFMGYAVLHSTRKPWMAGLAQSGPLLSVSPMLGDTPIVGPEPMLMAAALLFAAATVSITRERDKPQTGNIILLALSAALGITTKLTFAPLLIVPPIVFFRRWRTGSLWLVIFLASVCVLMLPAHQRFHETIVWVRALFWGSGFYGSGAHTIIDPAVYVHALGDMLAENAAIYLLALIGIITLASSFQRGGEDKRRSLLGLLLLIVLGVSLMSAKSYNPRYLNAGLVLSGLLIAAVAEFYGRRAALAGIVAALVLGVVTFGDAEARIAARVANNRAAEKLTGLLRTEFVGCQVAPYYLSGDPVYALKFGYDWARIEDDPYWKALHVLYGDRLFFDIWVRRFETWSGVATLADVLDHQPCVIFRGTPRALFKEDAILGRYVTEECHWGAEAVYVTGRHCRTAFAVYAPRGEN